MTNIVYVTKEFDWSDYTNSSPISDVTKHILLRFFETVILYLSEDDIRCLIMHPDLIGKYKHDWKYCFQVYDVRTTIENSHLEFL